VVYYTTFQWHIYSVIFVPKITGTGQLLKVSLVVGWYPFLRHSVYSSLQAMIYSKSLAKHCLTQPAWPNSAQPNPVYTKNHWPKRMGEPNCTTTSGLIYWLIDWLIVPDKKFATHLNWNNERLKQHSLKRVDWAIQQTLTKWAPCEVVANTGIYTGAKLQIYRPMVLYNAPEIRRAHAV